MGSILNREIRFTDGTNQSRFNFFVDVAKAYESEAGQFFLEGKASDTRVDQQKEKLSPSAIQSLKNQVDGSDGSIPVYPRHKSGWEDTLGYIISARIDEDNNLFIKIELDSNNPVAMKLWKMINKGRQFGLSVGGFLRTAYLEYDKEVKTIVKVLDDFEFDHVVVTTKPVNPRTWLHQIAKSLDEYMEEMPEGAEKEEDNAMSEELESQLEDTSVGESIENSASGLKPEAEKLTINNLASSKKREFNLSELKNTLENLESLQDAEKELVAKDMATIIKLYGQIFPPMLEQQEEGSGDMPKEDYADDADMSEEMDYDMGDGSDELELDSEEVDDIHTEAESLRYKQLASMVGTASDLLEQALAVMAVHHPEIIVSDEAQEMVDDGEEEAEHAGVDLKQELGMNEIQDLIRHSLDKWLSNYQYNAIDVLPGLDVEDELDSKMQEVDKSMARDVLQDDAFAFVEEMADGTKIRKLPYKRKNGKIDKRHLALALATLNGANGGVDLSEDQRHQAYGVLSSVWSPVFGKEAPPMHSMHMKVVKAENTTMLTEAPMPSSESEMEDPLSGEMPEMTGMDVPTEITEMQDTEAPQEFDELMPEQEQSEQQASSNVEDKLDQLANAMAQLQEQVMNMQRMMVGINKSSDFTSEFNQMMKKNETLVSKSKENVEENIKIVNDKIETVGNTVSKSIENLHHLAEKVDSLVKSQEELSPVLKSLENLPIRKAIVVDKNEPFKVAKALPTNEPSFNNSKEREAWVFDQLKNIPM